MPEIPQYVSRGEIRTGLRTPPRTPVPDIGAVIGQAFGPAVKEWEDAREALVAQQNKLDVVTLSAQYDAGLADLQLKVDQDPDYLQRDQKFIAGAMEMDRAIMEQVTSPAVAQAIRLHINRTLPLQAVQVRANALKAWQGAQRAQFDQVADDWSRKAAQADNPRVRDKYLDDYERLLEDGKKTVLTPEDAERRRVAFRDAVLVKQMDYLRRTNRDRLYALDRAGEFAELDPIARLKILEDARTDGEREQAQAERAFRLVTDRVEWDWSAKANFAQIPQADLEVALAGRHPHISPDKAREYARIQQNPPLGGADEPLEHIRDEYLSGSPSLDRIFAARRKVNTLTRDRGQGSEAARKFLNELQSDERSAESLEYQRIGVGQKTAQEEYESTREQTMKLPGPIGEMQENKKKARQAEINRDVRRGTDPKEAVKRALEKDKGEREAIPDRKKKLYELLE